MPPCLSLEPDSQEEGKKIERKIGNDFQNGKIPLAYDASHTPQMGEGGILINVVSSVGISVGIVDYLALFLLLTFLADRLEVTLPFATGF